MALETVIPGYRILEQLGEGGFAVVYRAVQESLERQVALKLLPVGVLGGRDAAARFLREGKLLATLSHPNLLTVFDAGRAGGQLYLAMELMDGGTLRHRVQERAPMAEDDVADLGRAVAAAVAHAHLQGILHRDLKPENVLLGTDGRIKVADFGLARCAGEGAELRTEPGLVIGTPGYVAPEVLLGKQASDVSDVHALGVMMFEMAAGQHPLLGGGMAEIVDGSFDLDARRLARRRPEISADLDRLVARCLDPVAERRPSMGEVRDELAGLLVARRGTQQLELPARVSGRRPRASLPPRVVLSPRVAGQPAGEAGGRSLTAVAAIAVAASLSCLGTFFWLRPGPMPIEARVVPAATGKGPMEKRPVTGPTGGGETPTSNVAGSPALPRPSISAGPGRLKLGFATATTGPLDVIVQAEGSTAEMRARIPADASDFTLAGLPPDRRMRLRLTAGDRTLELTATTLSSVSDSDVLVLEPARPGLSGESLARPVVASNGRLVAAAWWRKERGAAEVLVVRESEDCGVTWGPARMFGGLTPSPLSPSGRGQRWGTLGPGGRTDGGPCLAFDGRTLVMAAGGWPSGRVRIWLHRGEHEVWTDPLELAQEMSPLALFRVREGEMDLLGKSQEGLVRVRLDLSHRAARPETAVVASMKPLGFTPTVLLTATPEAWGLFLGFGSPGKWDAVSGLRVPHEGLSPGAPVPGNASRGRVSKGGLAAGRRRPATSPLVQLLSPSDETVDFGFATLGRRVLVVAAGLHAIRARVWDLEGGRTSSPVDLFTSPQAVRRLAVAARGQEVFALSTGLELFEPQVTATLFSTRDGIAWSRVSEWRLPLAVPLSARLTAVEDGLLAVGQDRATPLWAQRVRVPSVSGLGPWGSLVGPQ